MAAPGAEPADITSFQAHGTHDEKRPVTIQMTGSSDSGVVVDEKRPQPEQTSQKQKAWSSPLRVWRRFQPYVWDDPNKPKEEKLFLFKLDFFLLTYTCLGYFCKNLAQANINNAYVSGMKEQLNMNGNQLTYMSNVFTAGYVIGQIPAVILVTRVRPSILVPTAEVFWSVASFCCASVTTVQQLYGLRFLVGFFESAYFPCVVYLIGSWYTKEERAKRVVLFYSTATMASMFSGYLQAGAYKGLNGVMGHAGWQWLFIITGVIGLASGLLGYFFNPDFPENTRAFYLTASEATFARQRLLAHGYTPLGASAWDRHKILRIMKHWQFYLLPLGYFFVQSSLPSQQPVFNLWLKSESASVYNINVLPTISYGIGVFAQIAASMLSDSPLLHGRRFQPIIVLQAGTFFAVLVLAIWNVPHGLKFAAYCLSYMSAGVPGLYFAWFPELIPHDHEMRGFLVAFTNMFSYVNQIWWTDAVWRTKEGPEFKAGFTGAAVAGMGMVACAVVIRALEVRDERGRQREVEQERSDVAA